MVDARLHPADVVAHDEEDVRLRRRLRHGRRAGRSGQRHQHRRAQAARRSSCANPPSQAVQLAREVDCRSACGWTWRRSPLLIAGDASVLCSPDAPESKMARGGVDRLRVSRCRPVASAVVRRAQMRAALDDLPWNFLHWSFWGRSCRPRRRRADFAECSTPLPHPPDALANTSRPSIPRRCRSCRASRSRLAGKAVTGDVRSKPSALMFWRGNSPCQVLAM